MDVRSTSRQERPCIPRASRCRDKSRIPSGPEGGREGAEKASRMSIGRLAVFSFAALIAYRFYGAPAPGQRTAGRQPPQQEFGRTSSDERVELYTLRNRSGVEAAITNFGG